MALSLEQVRHVAKLAKLELTDAEAERFRAQLSAVLDAVALLDEVNTDGVMPTSHAAQSANPLREDGVVEPLGVERALANAPRRVDDCFAVPKVLD